MSPRELQLEQILEGFGEGICAFDFEWRITYCNEAAAVYAGMVRDEALGRVYWEVVPSALGSGFEAAFRDAMSGREPVELEVPSAIRPGGYVLVRAFPIEGGLGIRFTDISERTVTLQRERQQAHRLELALAASGLGDWEWDPATDQVSLSAAAATIFGLKAGARLGWADIVAQVHPDDRVLASTAVEGTVAGADGYEIEYRITPVNLGREIWLTSRARSHFDDSGRLVRLQGVVGDITQRKTQEAQLRESEARFRAMADSAPAPVWVTTAAGPIDFVNRAFMEFSGKPAASLIGDGWLAILHPEDLSAVASRRAQARERSEPYEFDARFRGASGDWRWMRASSRPRFDQNGVFQGYVGLAVDMTEIRAAEASQQLLINELNHRVKNTLATVQSLARQTLKDGVVTKAARAAFTERLLALSAAHNVLTRQNWESATIADLVAGATQPYGGVGATHIHAAGPSIEVGPRAALAISMALHELATNATKYGSLSQATGSVEIRWSQLPKGDCAELVWTERGGPPVQEPGTPGGFGLRLLTQGLASDLGNPARVSFHRAGLTCTLVVGTLR